MSAIKKTAQVQELPTVKLNTTQKVYNHGKKNDFPAQLINLVSSSGLAGNCINTLALYMGGEGLVFKKGSTTTPRMEDVLKHINRDIMPEFIRNYCLFEVKSVQVNHNGLGEITSLSTADSSALRLGEMTGFNVFPHIKSCGDWPNANEKFNATYPERFLQTFDLWEGKVKAKVAFDKNIQNQNPTPPSVYYDVDLNAGDVIYPTPYWFSGANAIYLDAEIIVWQVDNIDNNFNAAFLVFVRENLDALDADGKPKVLGVKDRLDERFTGSSRNGKNGGRYVLLYGDTEANKAMEIEAIPNTNTDKMFLALYEKVHQSVSETFGVPLALINGTMTSSLGSKEMLNAANLFNNTLYPKQQRLAFYFEKIVKDFEGWPEGVDFGLEIKPNLPYVEIPDLVYSQMTTEQLFEHFNIDIKPTAI